MIKRKSPQQRTAQARPHASGPGKSAHSRASLLRCRSLRLRALLSLILPALILTLWIIPQLSVKAQQITPRDAFNRAFDNAIQVANDQHFENLVNPPPALEDNGLSTRLMEGDFSDNEFQALHLTGSFDRYFQTISATHNGANAHGASLTVPYGTYQGDNLMGLTAFLSNGFGSPNLSERFLNFTQLSNGWDFEPRGLLVRLITSFDPTVVNSGDFSAPFNVQCHSVVRYVYLGPNGTVIYFQNRGSELSCDFTVTNTDDRTSCLPAISDVGAGASCQQGPHELWSIDGQISLSIGNNHTNAVLHYPNGDVEVLSPDGSGVSHPQAASVLSFNEPRITDRKQTWATSQRIDRNGNTTRFSSDLTTKLTTKVTDPEGREINYVRDNDGTLTSITAPGPGGTLLRWSLTWDTLTWNPKALFPDVDCIDSPPPNGFTVHGNQICINSLPYKTLTSLSIPDGRSYSFSYTFPADYKFGAQNGWGNVTQVKTPGGAVTKYDYGDDTTRSFIAPGQDLNQLPVGLGQSSDMNAIYRRRIDSVTIYPQGLSGPKLTTTIRNNNVETLLASRTSGKCYQLQWVRTNLPDGTIRKEAICDEGTFDPSALNGRRFAQETWDSTNSILLEGIYFGNTGNLGDAETTTGTMYIDEESASSVNDRTGHFLDIRPYKVIHIKDGVKWTERLSYEPSDIPANASSTCTSPCSAFRTLGNVTFKTIEDAQGAIVSSQLNTYYHPSAYITRNLIRLPETTRIRLGKQTFSRTDYLYDEMAFPLTMSGAPNLDTTYTTAERGNATTVMSYTDAQKTSGQISTHALYFDTGQVKEARDANENSVFNSYDFGLCSSAQPTKTTTVTNALGHTTSTTTDCYTGLVLTVTDPNNQSTYSQYDALGRLVETALPGDTLSQVAGFTHDPHIPLDRLAGATLGNNGQGPTTWIEYFSLGVINQQRTITHTKDGTADGRYVKTFLDGLGRTVQSRSEVDPNTSGNNAENVATTEYDNMGRVSKSYVPIFSSASDSYVTPDIGALATVTRYDSLGRVLTVTLPGLPQSRTDYTGAGTQWMVTSTDLNGNLLKTFTDVLGRTVKVSRRWLEGGADACFDPDPNLGKFWCSTTMGYDPAGRLLKTTDPNGNVMSFIYDGLGRKTQMTDPDMGTWNYAYDGNGNLRQQTDGNGQVIKMTYDHLNRVTLKDLPPVDVAGEEDVTYFYDGQQPSTCYSCDDHDANTQDCCDPATGTCYHQPAGSLCGSPPPPSPSPTPVAPSNLSATADSTSQITLGWTDNSNNETGFKIERSPDNVSFTLLATVGINITSYADSSLVSNTTYYYRVKATNGAGDSTPSNTASATTPDVPPAAPSNLTATADSTSQITLRWNDNSNNETGFKIERSTDGGLTFTQFGGTFPANLTTTANSGLLPGTTYHYRIKAVNGAGDSPFSNVASATTQSAPPTVPGNLRASTLSSSQISVSWDASSNQTGYVLERSLTSGTGFTQIATPGAGATNYTDATGLQPNTTYYYRIKATGAGGTQSAYSTQANATTACAAGGPLNPCCLTLTGFTTTTISFSWAPNGSNQNGYYIERSLNNVSFVRLPATIPASQTTYTDTGLTPGATYWYRVQAFNNNCTSTYSNTLMASTATTSGPPAAPGNLRSTNARPDVVSLAWNATANTLGYYVERSPNGNNSFTRIATLNANATFYNDFNVQASTTYWYRVQAYNSYGPSAYSNTLPVTTPAPDPPNAPSNLSCTAVSYEQITCTFTDNSNNESGFDVQRSTNPTSGFMLMSTLAANTGSSSTVSFSSSGLAQGTTYYFRVRADGNGPSVFSPWSNTGSATTTLTYSLSLSGNRQWFQVPYNSSLDAVMSPSPVSLTVEAWIKTTVDYQNGSCAGCPTQIVVSHFNPDSPGGSSGDGGYELWVNNKGLVKFASLKNPAKTTTVSSTNSILPNRWYHIAGVYNIADPDNGNLPTLSLYVQGVRVGMDTNPLAPRPSLSAQPLMIGRENLGTTNAPSFFNGKIDEVRISREAVYTGPDYIFVDGIEHSLGHLPSLATTNGLWKFDNQDGRDNSANANHNNAGTTQGNPTFASDVPGGQGIAAIKALFPQFFAVERWDWSANELRRSGD